MSDDLTLSFFFLPEEVGGPNTYKTMPHCHHCKHDLSQSAKTCPHCGDNDPLLRQKYHKQSDESVPSLRQYYEKVTDGSPIFQTIVGIIGLLGWWGVLVSVFTGTFFSDLARIADDPWWEIALVGLPALGCMVQSITLILSLKDYPKVVKEGRKKNGELYEEIKRKCGSDWTLWEP